MPRIPTYDPSGNLQVTYQSGAGAGLSEIGAAGQALQAFGAQRLEQQQRQQNAAWVSRTLAQTRSDWTARLLDAKTKAPAGADNFTQGLITQFDEQVKGTLETAPSQEARAIAEERLAGIRDDIWSNAAVFEANETVRYRREQVGSNINLAAAAVRGDAGQFDGALTETIAGIRALDIPAADRAELEATARQTLATAKYNALIDRNPDRAMQMLIAGGDAGYLGPDETERLINNAGMEIRRRQAEARAAAAEAKALAMVDFRFRLEDDRARVERGEARTIGDPEIIAMMGDKAGAREIADLNGSQQMATDLTSLALLPPPEQDALVESYKPGGENFAGEAGRFDTIIQARDKLRTGAAADPALYAMTWSPAVQQGFATAADSNKPEDLQKAIALSLQTQAQIGIDPVRQRTLSEPQAKLIVEKIKAAPAEQAADIVQGQAAAYGDDYWPRVYGELVKAGLPAPYRALASTDDPVARKQLAETLAMPQADLKKMAGEKAKDIEEAFDAEMAQFAATQAFHPGGSQVYLDYHDAGLGLAYKLGASMDATAAAKQAAAIVNDKYDFIQTDRIVARAPKDLGDRAALTANYLLQRLKPADLADNKAGDDPELQALKPEQRQELYLENVRRGLWVINEHDDGWMLLDEAGEPVQGADGSAVEFKFDAMPNLKTVVGRGGATIVVSPPDQVGGRP